MVTLAQTTSSPSETIAYQTPSSSFRPLSAAVVLGTQEWLTPDGQFIRNQGITPNMMVPLNASVTPLTPTVENASDMTEQQILSSGDAQLVAAIKYLEGQK